MLGPAATSPLVDRNSQHKGLGAVRTHSCSCPIPYACCAAPVGAPPACHAIDAPPPHSHTSKQPRCPPPPPRPKMYTQFWSFTLDQYADALNKTSKQAAQYFAEAFTADCGIPTIGGGGC